MTKAEIARRFGFADADALQKASTPIADVGNYTWYIARTPSGLWAVWDDGGTAEERANLADALRTQLAGLRMEIDEDPDGVAVDYEAIDGLLNSHRDDPTSVEAIRIWEEWISTPSIPIDISFPTILRSVGSTKVEFGGWVTCRVHSQNEAIEVLMALFRKNLPYTIYSAGRFISRDDIIPWDAFRREYFWRRMTDREAEEILCSAAR